MSGGCARERTAALSSGLPMKQGFWNTAPKRVLAHSSSDQEGVQNQPSNEQESPKAGKVCCDVFVQTAVSKDSTKRDAMTQLREDQPRGHRRPVFGFGLLCDVNSNHFKSLS